MGSGHIAPLASYRGSSSAMDRRGWNLALELQEVVTIIVRLRYNRQAVTDANSFRAEMKKHFRVAEQRARSRGYGPDDVKQAIFAVVAFLDESVLSSRNPAFADWPRLPLQAELFGHQLAGEIFFQELQKVLNRPDTNEVGDLLEVYALCLLLGFKGRFAGTASYGGSSGDLRQIQIAVQEKIRRIRGSSGALSPRGGIPADAVRLAQTDPWVRRLLVTMIATTAITIVAGIMFKLILFYGASAISGTAR
jgi:type VI secretion system protein ImpK